MTTEGSAAVLGHIHQVGDGDDSVFSTEDTAQIVDLVRAALGGLLDPPEPVGEGEESGGPHEFWFAQFPVLVTFCGGCATVQVQVIGRSVETVHFSIEMAEKLRGIVRVADPDMDYVITYQRRFHPEHAEDVDQPFLYMTRVTYRVLLPETDPVWAMLAEMVTLFDNLLEILVAAVKVDE